MSTIRCFIVWMVEIDFRPPEPIQTKHICDGECAVGKNQLVNSLCEEDFG